MRPSTYFKTFWRSLTSIEYYASVLQAPLWFSVRFFLITITLIGLIAGALYGRETRSYIEQQTPLTVQEVSEHFPQDGSIRWNGSRLEVTPDPFPIYYPHTLPESFKPASGKLAVLTNQETHPSDFFSDSEQPALSLITPTTIFIRSSSGWVEGSLDQQLQDELLLVTPETLPQHLAAIEDWVAQALPALTYLFPIATAATLLIHRVWIVLLESLLIFVLFRFNQIPLPARKAAQLSLHILIPAEVVHQIAHFVYPELPFSLLSLTFWVILLYLFFSQRKRMRRLLIETS